MIGRRASRGFRSTKRVGGHWHSGRFAFRSMRPRRALATPAMIALPEPRAAAAAAADVTRAESVLPPGESGLVSTPGLADGTGSPHLYDQQQRFIDFSRKDD